MAVIKTNGGYMSLPIQIQRGNPIPLDKYAVWYNEAQMRDYARNNPVAYVGQFLSLVNETTGTTTAYVITNTAGDIQEIGAGSMSADGKSIEIVNESVQLKDFGVRYYKYVKNEGDTEGTYVLTEGWITGLEPKVAQIDGEYVLAWYEPNPTTIEGVSSTVASLKTTVDSHSESINDLTSKVNGLSNVFRFRGSVEALNTLDTSSLSNGDVYQVKTDGSEWVWNDTEWIELGTNVDLSGYATTAELTAVSGNLSDLQEVVGTETVEGTAGTGLIHRIEEVETSVSGLQAVGGEANVIEAIYAGTTELEPVEKTVIIPIYTGTTDGLVPVIDSTLVLEGTTKEDYVLTGSGSWAQLKDKRIGNLTYNGITYNTVEEFIAAYADSNSIVWEQMT